MVREDWGETRLSPRDGAEVRMCGSTAAGCGPSGVSGGVWLVQWYLLGRDIGIKICGRMRELVARAHASAIPMRVSLIACRYFFLLEECSRNDATQPVDWIGLP